MFCRKKLCNRIYQLKHIQKLEILYEFDVSFHTNVPIYWIFTQAELSSIYRNKPIFTWTVKRCLQSGEIQSCSYYFFLLFGREDSNHRKRVAMKYWNAAITKYIQQIFCCVMEKLLNFHINEILSGVMWYKAEHT